MRLLLTNDSGEILAEWMSSDIENDPGPRAVPGNEMLAALLQPLSRKLTGQDAVAYARISSKLKDVGYL